MKLFDIFKIYFLIGCQLIGGGYVILPLLRKYLIEKRNWLKEEELIEYVALSQCLPGIIALNISIFSGWRLNKLKGSLIAVFGLILPSFIIVSLISLILYKISDMKIVENLFFGIRLSMLILLFNMIYDIFKTSMKSYFSYFLFFFILFMIIYTSFSPVILIILAILISILKGGHKN